jgi:DnaJ-class molecular chaperone
VVSVKFQPGCLDINKNIEVGDMKYVIKGELMKHEIYTIGSHSGDLVVTLPVQLKHSLTETYIKKLTFLDGKILIIKPDFIIKPNDKYIIAGKGITKRSNLQIIFEVIFPERFNDKRKEYLKKVFNISAGEESDIDSDLCLSSNVKLIPYSDNEEIQGFHGAHGTHDAHEGFPGMHGIPGMHGFPGMQGGVKVQGCAQQ